MVHTYVSALIVFVVALTIQQYYYFLYGRALISCCSVARAQHLVQNSRFAQQPPRGWLRAAQNASLGGQRFSSQAKKFVARLLFDVGEKNIWGCSQKKVPSRRVSI